MGSTSRLVLQNEMRILGGLDMSSVGSEVRITHYILVRHLALGL